MWKEGVGDLRLRQPMALSVDVGSENGGEPSNGDEAKPNRARKYPTVCALAVATPITLIFIIIYCIDQWLPSPAGTWEASSQPERYNALRASEKLAELCRIGVRTAGSETNDRVARAWVEEQLKLISESVHKSKRVEVDTQYITGSFQLAFRNSFVSAYDGLVNVVARLSDIHSNTSETLLVNCHFDTVPSSPGASDDGVNCAHMLEILEILSKQSTLLTYSIIFLFNGAEENGLQGAHGFITQHKWANSVKAFVNLEACGAGGREILFQSAAEHPWMVEAYAESVPRPHGFVIGEEIFQSGLIPSDTDFRIFRDFSGSSSKLPGLDIAYYRNGYVYHTEFDDLTQTSLSSMQHTGDNLLALITRLANSRCLKGSHVSGLNSTVYFDLFGFKMIYYSKAASSAVGICLILLSIYTMFSTLLHLDPGMHRKQLCFQGMKAVVGPLSGWALAFYWCFCVVRFVNIFGGSMVWYSQPLLLIPLYGIPTFLGATIGVYIQYALTKLPPLCPDVRVQLLSLGVQMIWTIMLIILMFMRYRSAYLLQVMVFFPFLATFLVLWCARPGSKVGTWVCLQLGAVIVPISFVFYHILSFMGLLIPLMGRLGPEVDSELIIGGFTCVCTLFCISYLAPMVPLLESPGKVFRVLLLVHLIVFGYVVSPFSSAYTGPEDATPKPQRVYAFQVQRQFINSEQRLYYNDSGLWIVPMDWNTGSKCSECGKIVSAESSLSPNCKDNLTCGLPVYTPRWLDLGASFVWLPTTVPSMDPNTTLSLKQKKKIKTDVYRMEFEITGPSHLGVILCPYPKVALEGSSVAAGMALPISNFFEGRPLYFIYVGRGFEKVAEPWTFWIDLKVLSTDANNLIDVVAMGHYFTDVPFIPKMTERLINKHPWKHLTTWSSWFVQQTFDFKTLISN